MIQEQNKLLTEILQHPMGGRWKLGLILDRNPGSRPVVVLLEKHNLPPDLDCTDAVGRSIIGLLMAEGRPSEIEPQPFQRNVRERDAGRLLVAGNALRVSIVA